MNEENGGVLCCYLKGVDRCGVINSTLVTCSMYTWMGELEIRFFGPLI